VQLKGPEIAEWNETGKTANLDAIANDEGWDKVVAPDLLPVMKPTGHWVAAPMNIHRINWIWRSTKAMEQAGIKSLPKAWAEFNADCDKAVAAHLPFQRGLVRRHDGRLRNGPEPLQESFRRGRHRGDALA
jgi:glucose/mannose transport system substrate-binding protein